MRQLDYIAHHGILGQKWGVRRFQNADGSLTNAGKKRYYRQIKKDMLNDRAKFSNEYEKTKEGKAQLTALKQKVKEIDSKDYSKTNDEIFKDSKELHALNEEHLRASGEYEAKKMIAKYGEDMAYMSLTKGRIRDKGEDVVKAYSDLWYINSRL
jgi:hypothetical protein